MRKLISLLLAVVLLPAVPAVCSAAETTEIRVLATSDTHGMFCPWDYALDEPFAQGSLAQVASAVAALRDENTLVLDAGDIIQDNSAELFLEDDLHPMAAAMNAIGYDAWTAGNHEFNYGLDTLRRFISQLQAEALIGNVWDRDGQPLGRPWVILERGGVRIGVIGMVTPNILLWDTKNLDGCTVTSPIAESRKAIDELRGRVDILVGLMHMGLDEEYGTEGSGAVPLAEACPEFDVIIASHGHLAVPGEMHNGVLIVENRNLAQTMSEIVLTVERDAEGCRVTGKTSRLISIGDYPQDEALRALLQPYHERAIGEAHREIGRLEGGDLAPGNEIPQIPQALVEDTAMLDLINRVQLYYSGARVSATALTNLKSMLREGPIRSCDLALIYRYANTLYTLEMSGKQLKQYMEWSARIFGQVRDGDLTLSFDPSVAYYDCIVFAGVNYEVDVSRPAGSRIRNLTWPDGTPVAEDERFVFASNNYQADSRLLTPGTVYAEGEELPVLLESDVHVNDIGNIRALTARYITEVLGGVLTPEVDGNWRLTGCDWDEALHDEAVRRINEGSLTLETGNSYSSLNAVPVTVEDLK